MLHLLKDGVVVMVVPVGATITHDGFTVSPASITSMLPEGYTFVEAPPAPDPEPLTPEELRAQMPDKTPREFRDILIDEGILTDAVPDEVTVKINQIPFDIERMKALNAWNNMSVAQRVDPYVDMIGAMFGRSPEEIDILWVR